MNLFDQLTDKALKNTPDLGVLRVVVEKELLHHDILRELADFGALSSMVFMGGTCLRACYGSVRLSEDLDFYGGAGFHPEDLEDFPKHLTRVLMEKYSLPVEVRVPKPSLLTNVDTWKVSIVTKPERPDLPAQRIHLDICSLPSQDPRPMVLRNPYGVDMGTSGLILQAASREEILADKFVVLALRRGRMKYRDLWDIHWLIQATVTFNPDEVIQKADLHGYTASSFKDRLSSRLQALEQDPIHQTNCLNELKRFLPVDQIQNRADQPVFWTYLLHLLRDQTAPLLDQT